MASHTLVHSTHIAPRDEPALYHKRAAIQALRWERCLLHVGGVGILDRNDSVATSVLVLASSGVFRLHPSMGQSLGILTYVCRLQSREHRAAQPLVALQVLNGGCSA